MNEPDLTARSWDSPEQRVAGIQWYADKHRVTVMTDVPITGPNWRGWGPGCPRHIATVALNGGDPGVVCPFNEAAFSDAVAGNEPLRPILPWGGAGRYALGWLLAYKAYLERSWQPKAPVHPLALVAPGAERPNTASAFEAFDIDIVAIDGEPRSRRGGGDRPAVNDPWENPKPGSEDVILQDLWKERNREGWWLAEVPIGAAPPRRLDAVVIPWPEARHSKAGADIHEFRDAVSEGPAVELIEAKRRPDENALGQLLGGKHMFTGEYPGHGELAMTACVREPGREPEQWLYQRYPVKVELLPADGQ